MNSDIFDNSSVVSHPSDNSCSASPVCFPVVKTVKKGVPETAHFGQNPKNPLQQGFSAFFLVFTRYRYFPADVSINIIGMKN